MEQIKNVVICVICIIIIVCTIAYTKEPSKTDKVYFNARDYQIEITQDSIYLYDLDRYVGAIKCDSSMGTPLDTLIYKDNE